MGETEPINLNKYSYVGKICYPFLPAIMDTLKELCSVNSRPGSPDIKNPLSNKDFSMVISATLINDIAIGTVSIYFPKLVILKIIGKMMGETYTELNEETADAAKEFMNIAFNKSKALIEKGSTGSVRSMPQIVYGDKIVVSFLSRGQSIWIPFETDFGEIAVELIAQESTISDKA